MPDWLIDLLLELRDENMDEWLDLCRRSFLTHTTKDIEDEINKYNISKNNNN